MGSMDAEPVDLGRLLTVVVAANPIWTHPSPDLILSVIASLELLGIDDSVPLVLAHDAVRPGAPDQLSAGYSDYLDNLRQALNGRPNVTIVVRDEWGHLSGCISNALGHVETPFMLVCQHDLAFVRPVDLSGLVRALANRPDIRHVRFNKTENVPTTWDGEPTGRRRFFTEEVVGTEGGDIRLTRTIGWSDNNHLCRADYYRRVILPLVGDRRIHPEHAANLAASPHTHDILGTYIYGGPGEPPVLHHLDGRGRGAEAASQRTSGRLQPLRRLARTNRTRVSVGVDRILYKIRIRRIRRTLATGAPTTARPRP